MNLYWSKKINTELGDRNLKNNVTQTVRFENLMFYSHIYFIQFIFILMFLYIY